MYLRFHIHDYVKLYYYMYMLKSFKKSTNSKLIQEKSMKNLTIQSLRRIIIIPNNKLIKITIIIERYKLLSMKWML